MEELNKEKLIQDIKHLISVDGKEIEINSNYLAYFTQEELLEMRGDLIVKKTNINETTKEYVNELYEKLSL